MDDLLAVAMTRELGHRVRLLADAHDSSIRIESFVQQTIRRCQTPGLCLAKRQTETWPLGSRPCRL